MGGAIKVFSLFVAAIASGLSVKTIIHLSIKDRNLAKLLSWPLAIITSLAAILVLNEIVEKYCKWNIFEYYCTGIVTRPATALPPPTNVGAQPRKGSQKSIEDEARNLERSRELNRVIEQYDCEVLITAVSLVEQGRVPVGIEISDNLEIKKRLIEKYHEKGCVKQSGKEIK